MDNQQLFTGKIIAIFGKDIKLYHQGDVYNASIRGKLLKEYQLISPVAVGDNVEFKITIKGQVVIENVLPRKQYLARPGKLVKGKVQVIAANLDQLVIISSTQNPNFKPGLIDRFLVSALNEKLKAVIVINKIDLTEKNIHNDYLDAWRSVGFPAIYTSAKTGEGIEKLISLLKGKSSAMAGHSGVGKSSLLNAIKPSLKLATKKISKASGRGVHTTSSVIMFPLDSDSWVVDTPGIKVFGLTGIDKNNLFQNFPEMAELSGKCRFNNCLHISEPDCAVKKAVETGSINKFRYLSYKRIWEQLDE
ncbi:MAG: ribosome small subunit-dependent GTPase A [candidate division Zixibacteria bacterium]|nr:ribosome small subunit-dependent GTPase A [candidate division Zixibacteria bacterium]